MVSITTDITEEETGKLFRLGLLREHESEDRKAIVRALHALVASVDI